MHELELPRFLMPTLSAQASAAAHWLHEWVANVAVGECEVMIPPNLSAAQPGVRAQPRRSATSTSP